MNRLSINIIICSLSLFCVSNAMAQTKVQCVTDSNGGVTAALIWQNTLGVERANAICRSAVGAIAASTRAQADQPQDAGLATGEQIVARNAPVQQPPTILASHQPQPQSVSGQRFASNVYQRAAAEVVGVSPPVAPNPITPPVPVYIRQMNQDYVPLEQAGQARASDSGGYIEIW